MTTITTTVTNPSTGHVSWSVQLTIRTVQDAHRAEQLARYLRREMPDMAITLTMEEK